MFFTVISSASLSVKKSLIFFTQLEEKMSSMTKLMS